MPKKQNSQKIIHYIQLRTHRQWPNPLTYMSHLEAYYSKIKPIIYDTDRLLNNKWINILQPQIINQFNEIYQQEIKNYFLYKINLIDYKYFSLNIQYDENSKFLREIFSRSIEITDYLLYLYNQIENSQYNIYEYRLNILKYEFEQEQNSLNDLFINQELNELNNQINILNAIEQDHILQQFIQFKLKKRELQEKFIKDITILHSDFKIQISSLKSTINKIIHSNNQQINGISKHCHYLYEKTDKTKTNFDQEMKLIFILKRKIREIKKQINDIETNRNHIYDKLNRLKQCSHYKQNKLISKTNISQSNKAQIIFRRLCVLINNVQKNCQKKLLKAEQILFLINQCHRLELEDEKLFSITPKINLNKISYLENCHFQFDSYFDELSLFWKRYAHNN